MTIHPIKPATVVIFTNQPNTTDELVPTDMYASGIRRQVRPTA